MINEILQQIYELDENIIIDTLEVTEVDDRKSTKIKFKRVEPMVQLELDTTQPTSNLGKTNK